MEPVGIHATERRNHEAEQRGSDRTRQRKIGRTADRLRERARLRRGAGVPAGLLTAGSGLSGSGAEGGGRKRVHHADRVDDRNRQDAACTASKHTSLQCADCHTDTATLAKQHEGASSDDRMPSRLKQTTVEASVCLSCHDQDEIAAESSSCTALSDAQGTTVNPHELPETDTHGQIACTDCHSMHEEQTDLQGDAKAYCMSCHHADVFECYTCHEHS